MELSGPEVAAALAATYAGVTEIVTPLDDRDLLLPSGCRGWTICDLLFHLTLDAQRALVALASPASGPPDVDFVSYWPAYPGAGNADAANEHAQWARRMAAAYTRPSGVVPGWRTTAAAAARAAAAADPAGLVSTQDHVLTVPDFLATLVTEAVVHHLDLIVSLPEAPPPPAIDIARATLTGLAGPEGLPKHWSGADAVRRATGRTPLDSHDRQVLGVRAELIPLLS